MEMSRLINMSEHLKIAEPFVIPKSFSGSPLLGHKIQTKVICMLFFARANAKSQWLH